MHGYGLKDVESPEASGRSPVSGRTSERPGSPCWGQGEACLGQQSQGGDTGPAVPELALPHLSPHPLSAPSSPDQAAGLAAGARNFPFPVPAVCGSPGGRVLARCRQDSQNLLPGTQCLAKRLRLVCTCEHASSEK